MAGPNPENRAALETAKAACTAAAARFRALDAAYERIIELEQEAAGHARDIYLAQAEGYGDGYRDGYADGQKQRPRPVRFEDIPPEQW